MSQIWTTLVTIGILAATGKSTENNVEVSMAAPDHSTFRKDYNFYPAAQGWMKLHRVPTDWNSARVACFLEGARLASPLNEGLYMTMRMVLHSNQVKSMYTGVRTLATVDDYLSVEGVHINEMPVWWAENEPDNTGGEENCLAMKTSGAMADVPCESRHAFMCYKPKVGSTTMNECGNNDNKYVRDVRTGSCYKFHQAATWQRAHSVCTAEGGHLAVINSEQEAQVLKELVNKENFEGFVFIGFYNWARYPIKFGTFTHWSTIDGKTLEEAGFPRWARGEPNNLGGNELCGSFIHKRNDPILLNDSNCEAKLRFICEIKA